MWFVGTGRAGAAHADGVAARLRKAESDERSCQDVLGDYDRAHRELEERVERLEAELAEARREKLEAFARWWNCREDRDRARHVARRLRRRLKRIHRRETARGRAAPAGAAEDGRAVDVPAQAEGPDGAVRPQRSGHPDHSGYPGGVGHPDGGDRAGEGGRAERNGPAVRWADPWSGRGRPPGADRADMDRADTAEEGANGRPGGRRAGGSGPIPSQREDAEGTGGSGGVGGDRERQRPRVGWKRANGDRRRPRE
ncbi:hypothetical protein [Nocardiopsis suaedae]|uniref:Uncharacterized protein n=1 Tax=Nocardiopsis suaedae TaxID=3018444 RepID=A0ABT4TT21_9ACTN|nr:hypothetical protein [Nocardiopsis suaedae]MDA2807843.1 hypothetical protein [Nocardiopsis suaedae]